MTAAGNRPESVHAKPKPLAVAKHSSYVESRGFILHSRSNDNKNTTQSRWIKIYSSKILFTSFHLNNQTDQSGRRSLSSCCFCLILIFSRSVRTATLDTSFRPPLYMIPHQYQFAFQFGSEGKEQEQFDKPWGIAVNDKRKTLAVADLNNSRIQMFGFDGNFLREIAMEGGTYSVAFTESGDLLSNVARRDSKLSLYTEGGQFIRYISDEHVKIPWHISAMSDGRIITCNKDEKTIKVLSPDGKNLLQSFRAPGCDGEPWCAVYQPDKFFVSYPMDDRVMVFNNAGEYLHDIGSEGSGDGQFSAPTGLAIDKFNRLIVCDVDNDRLQLSTLDGKYVAKVAGSFFDHNSHLFRCAVSSTGHLFVTDLQKNCIYVFN